MRSRCGWWSVLPAVCAGGREPLSGGQGQAEEAERRGIDAGEQLPHQAAGGDQGGGYSTTDKSALAGLSDAEDGGGGGGGEGAQGGGLRDAAAAEHHAAADLASLERPRDAQAIFENSWNRAERGDANDTRETIARLAQLRAQKAKLLGYRTYAAWNLEDQMAKTPEAAVKFMDALVPASTAKAGEGKDIQAVIDAQQGRLQLAAVGLGVLLRAGAQGEVRLDESQVKPYFELNNVLRERRLLRGHQLYGLTFKERKDIPVYAAGRARLRGLRRRRQAAGALLLRLLQARQQERRRVDGASLVDQSKLLGTLPVVYNVANFQKPAPGEPALISFDDVTTMFHEFGHALHGMFANVEYPSLSGTQVPRDFVEFPSQFNEHWASYPAVFDHYAKHYKTGAPMPRSWRPRSKGGNLQPGIRC
jgi:peptidyl-dipeptidase Dcp